MVGMRARALLLIFLTASWLLPAGVSACPADSPAEESHTHSGAIADHHHEAATAHEGDHHHAAPAPVGDDDAPLDGPVCCRDEGKAPAVVASVLDAKPRPKAMAVLVKDLPLPAPPEAALRSGAWLRLRQPPPSPYARSRRPLLI